MTELIPRLFIGNWHEARDSEGFYKITVAIDSPFIGNEHFKIIDGPGNDENEFEKAVHSVYAAHMRGERILVHCVGGRSRSAVVIVAAATIITNKPMCEVYDSLLAKHDCTRIHPYLSLLLLDYAR